MAMMMVIIAIVGSDAMNSIFAQSLFFRLDQPPSNRFMMDGGWMNRFQLLLKRHPSQILMLVSSNSHHDLAYQIFKGNTLNSHIPLVSHIYSISISHLGSFLVCYQ